MKEQNKRDTETVEGTDSEGECRSKTEVRYKPGSHVSTYLFHGPTCDCLRAEAHVESPCHMLCASHLARQSLILLSTQHIRSANDDLVLDLNRPLGLLMEPKKS